METLPPAQCTQEAKDRRMDIALCYESVLPARGGAETYLGDLARRLARDGHAVHLYACRWDAASLPAATHFHRHDVTVGFDKTWGQDVLYPQGGLHAASAAQNQLKFATRLERAVATVGKWLDPAA